MGKKGGATKGPSKVRGDSEYYRAIRAKRKATPKTLNTTKQSAGTGPSPEPQPYLGMEIVTTPEQPERTTIQKCKINCKRKKEA
jgi:hypothetical protein